MILSGACTLFRACGEPVQSIHQERRLQLEFRKAKIWWSVKPSKHLLESPVNKNTLAQFFGLALALLWQLLRRSPGKHHVSLPSYVPSQQPRLGRNLGKCQLKLANLQISNTWIQNDMAVEPTINIRMVSMCQNCFLPSGSPSPKNFFGTHRPRIIQQKYPDSTHWLPQKSPNFFAEIT